MLFLYKLAKKICVVVPTQKIPFYLFFRYFTGKWCNQRKKYSHIHHQWLNINTKWYFVFRFTIMFILTVIFAILVGHIVLKKLTENAEFQSHTMPIAEEQNMSIWRNLLKNWRREGAAKEITKKFVMTSNNGFFSNFVKNKHFEI